MDETAEAYNLVIKAAEADPTLQDQGYREIRLCDRQPWSEWRSIDRGDTAKLDLRNTCTLFF
jgi:hypothetical protein